MIHEVLAASLPNDICTLGDYVYNMYTTATRQQIDVDRCRSFSFVLLSRYYRSLDSAFRPPVRLELPL